MSQAEFLKEKLRLQRREIYECRQRLAGQTEINRLLEAFVYLMILREGKVTLEKNDIKTLIENSKNKIEIKYDENSYTVYAVKEQENIPDFSVKDENRQI